MSELVGVMFGHLFYSQKDFIMDRKVGEPVAKRFGQLYDNQGNPTSVVEYTTMLEIVNPHDDDLKGVNTIQEALLYKNYYEGFPPQFDDTIYLGIGSFHHFGEDV